MEEAAEYYLLHYVNKRQLCVQLTLRQLLHHRWGFVEEAAEYDMLNYVNKRQLYVQLTLKQLLHHRWGCVEEALDNALTIATRMMVTQGFRVCADRL